MMTRTHCLIAGVLFLLINHTGIGFAQPATFFGDQHVIIYDVALREQRQEVAATTGAKIQIWNFVTKKLQKEWTVSRIAAIEFQNDNLIGISRDGFIYVWEPGTGLELRKEKISDSPINCLTVVDSTYVATGNEAGEIVKWNSLTGKTEFKLDTKVMVTALRSDGRWLISGNNKGAVSMWNSNTGALESTTQVHAGWVRDLALPKSGKKFISVGDQGVVKRWSLDAEPKFISKSDCPMWALCTDYLVADKLDVRAVGARNGAIRIISGINYTFKANSTINAIAIVESSLPKIQCIAATGSGIVMIGADHMKLVGKSR